jgi:hypothetical protein
MQSATNEIKLICTFCGHRENSPQVYNKPYTKPVVGDYTVCEKCGTIYKFVKWLNPETLVTQILTEAERKIFKWLNGSPKASKIFVEEIINIIKKAPLSYSAPSSKTPYTDSLFNNVTIEDRINQLKNRRNQIQPIGVLIRNKIFEKNLDFPFVWNEIKMNQDQAEKLMLGKIPVHDFPMDAMIKLCKILQLTFSEIETACYNTFFELQFKISQDIIAFKNPEDTKNLKDPFMEQQKMNQYMKELKLLLDEAI